MTTKKLIYIVGGSLAGVTVAYFVYDIIKTRKNKKLNESVFDGTDVNLNQNNSNPNNTVIVDEVEEAPVEPQESNYKKSGHLSVGDKGIKVFLLQSALNQLGASLVADGKFGQMTYNAYNKYADEWWTCGLTYTCQVTPTEYSNTLNKAKGFGWNKSSVQKQAEKYWTSASGGNLLGITI